MISGSNFTITDIFILIILVYLLAEIAICIYKSIRGLHDPIRDISYKSKPIESFKQDSVGSSLDSLNNSLYLKFPGKYKETLYRPVTINTTIVKLVGYLVKPILDHINREDEYHFKLGDIIYLTSREYENGVVYYLEFFIRDPYQALSKTIKLELVINQLGLYHINYAGLVNKSRSEHQVGPSPSDCHQYASYNSICEGGPHSYLSIKKMSELKKTILPSN